MNTAVLANTGGVVVEGLAHASVAEKRLWVAVHLV